MAENEHDPIIHQLERAIDKNYATDQSFGRASVEAHVAIANELARIADQLEAFAATALPIENIHGGN